MKRICYIVTVSDVINNFYKSYINEISQNNLVYILGKDVSSIKFKSLNKNIILIDINISRSPTILKDLYCFIKLYFFIKKNNFHLVHTLMPKSGFLGIFAAKLCNVKYRLHTFTGQLWSNKKGIKKFLFKLIDKFIILHATHLACDGILQKKFILNNINTKKKIFVIGKGSISGVNLDYFKNSKHKKIELRKKFKISKKEIVFLYVGRLNKEKGIDNLILSIKNLKINSITNRWIFVGNDEMQFVKNYKKIFFKYNIHYYKYQKNIKNFFQMADIFFIPSFREGFSVSTLQAISMSLPILGSNIYGIKDMVKNNYNGLLFNPFNIDSIKNCIEIIKNDKIKIITFGNNSRKIAERYYDEKKFIKSFVEYYKNNFKI